MTTEPCQPDALLYNSKIVANYVKFARQFHSGINTNELLSYAKMEPYQVEDEDYWFTQEQIDLFHARLVELTKVKNISREVGRYAASSDSLGFMKSYALGFVNPAIFCKIVGKASGHFTRSCSWESKEIGSNSVQITVTPRPGVQEKLFQCENRMGYLDTVFALYKRKLPTIEHTECVFNGAESCKYVVSWSKFRSDIWRRARNCLTLFLCAVSGVLLFTPVPEISVVSMFVSFMAVLFLSTKVWNMEKEELFSAMENLRTTTDALLNKVATVQNNARLIYEVGLTLTRQKDIDGILKDVTQILEKRLDYDRGMIFLANKEKSLLSSRAGFGYSGEDLSVARDISFRIRPESKGILVECFQHQRPYLINDIDEIEHDLSFHSLDFARKVHTKSFICCPITCADEAIGVLAVDNMKTKRPLLQSDLDLLMVLAPEIGVSIQNAVVTDMKEKQFNSILHVLASSIDARDPLTAGHSERVTRFATGICKELGLAKEFCEMIRVASLLHDYGKIAIRDSILKKPGSLTTGEYEEIKTHATKTKEILQKIEFEGIYKEVPEIASSHHEKWDGTGYPKGLRFKDIPLGARILAVADVFEAVTSMRHYRAPMPLEEALDLLESNKHRHFDPLVVDAFIQYYQKEGQALDSQMKEQGEGAQPSQSTATAR